MSASTTPWLCGVWPASPWGVAALKLATRRSNNDEIWAAEDLDLKDISKFLFQQSIRRQRDDRDRPWANGYFSAGFLSGAELVTANWGKSSAMRSVSWRTKLSSERQSPRTGQTPMPSIASRPATIGAAPSGASLAS